MTGKAIMAIPIHKTISPKFAQPMRELCKNLTEERIDCGHWMAQEKPEELNKILGNWLKSI